MRVTAEAHFPAKILQRLTVLPLMQRDTWRKNIVAAGLADKCEIQIAYAIGVAKPVSVLVDTFGTAKIPEAEIEERVSNNFDLRPAAIIRDLDLRRPIYRQVAAYGHFGRTDIDVPWERTDKAELLK